MPAKLFSAAIFGSVMVASVATTGCAFAPANYTGSDAPRADAIQPLKATRPLVALVLGAGGARGFAHVGVIKALEQAGISADIVVGTSSGALVAALYAGGVGADKLEEMAFRLRDGDLFDYTIFGPGVVEGARLQEFINDTLAGRPIEALNKPFAAIATQAANREMAVFNRGNTGMAVRASASIPKLFWPVIIGGNEYIDGGYASRVPAKVARNMGADVVIAVDISYRGSSESQTADVVIRPQTMRSRVNDFQHKRDNITAGEEAAREVVAQIKQRIEAVAAAKAARAPMIVADDSRPVAVKR